MKRTILSLSVYTLIINVNAQVFDMTSSWTEIATNLFEESYCYVRNYKLNGDTTINDMQYTKIYLNDVLYDAALRETSDNKVYAYFYSLEAERLIYDFDWAIGKTICSEHYEPQEDDFCVEIMRIDNIQLLDGNYYQQTTDIIRGIGNIKGFFWGIQPVPLNGDQYALLCFSRNGQLVYKNNLYKTCDDCEKTKSGFSMTENNKNLVWVSQSETGIIIQFADNNNSLKRFYLYDTAGKVWGIYQITGQNILNVNNLTAGCYLYQAIGDNNENFTGSFIVK